MDISIHAPREGSDCTKWAEYTAEREFQSTLPARGATQNVLGKNRSDRISIHAPREGSDIVIDERCVQTIISIHAPREGSDYINLTAEYITLYFNPRSPRGERHAVM